MQQIMLLHINPSALQLQPERTVPEQLAPARAPNAPSTT